jgi:ABC-2 type transport system ATP-binding protein
MKTDMINTQNLCTYYSNGKVKALQDFSIQIDRGRIFSLLGPNGAGKTTLIKTLLGIIHPTSGEAYILGQPISNYHIHSRIGYLAENHRFPYFLTAHQTLYYYGKMAGISKSDLQDKIPELLALVKLSDWQDTKIHKYSKGMMQRLGLAHALINDPDLLFLDEPTDGIDPVGRREIRDLLKELRDRGKTIFLNSHLLSEVELVSDEIAILKAGQLLERGLLEDLISVKEQFQLKLDAAPEKITAFFNNSGIKVSHDNLFYTISISDDQELNHLIDRLRAEKIVIRAIIPKKISLEDHFIDIIDESDRDKK